MAIDKFLITPEKSGDAQSDTQTLQKEESVLDKISASDKRLYYEGWRNGWHGSICRRGNIYRFIEMTRGEAGVPTEVKMNEDDNPIVAIGIVAYWLMLKSKQELEQKCLTTSGNGMPQDFGKMFETYTKDLFNQFRDSQRDNSLTWDWDWEYEFYAKIIIPQEIASNKITETLFDYVTNSDINLVRAIMKSYIKYLKKCRTERGYRVSPELLVLRYVDSRDDSKYEDLEDYEVNTILTDLEEKGYILVAWIEGHRHEAARMLDKGRTYLKQLEERECVKVIAPANAPQPSSEKPSTEALPDIVGYHKQHEHPSIIDEEDWDDSLDDVFTKKVKPQEIKKALETLTSTTLSEEKRRFVYYKVLVYIRYIPTEKRGSKKNFLKWWNLHFNCNWVKTETSDPFKFRINSRLMNSQPYEWNKIDMDNANDYYDFAKTVKNTFTQTVINNVAQDGQDFNAGPLFDRGQFLKDTHKPINNGITYFKT